MNAAPPAHSFIWRRERSEVNVFSVGAAIGGEEASGNVLEAIGSVWRGVGRRFGGRVVSFRGFLAERQLGRNWSKGSQLKFTRVQVGLKCKERQEVGLRVVAINFEIPPKL